MLKDCTAASRAQHTPYKRRSWCPGGSTPVQGEVARLCARSDGGGPLRERSPAAVPWAPPRQPGPASPPDQAPHSARQSRSDTEQKPARATYVVGRQRYHPRELLHPTIAPIALHQQTRNASPCHVAVAHGKHPKLVGSGSTFLLSTGALVSIIWQAVCRPTRRGRRCVPPKPGRMPSCSSGRPSLLPAPRQLLPAATYSGTTTALTSKPIQKGGPSATHAGQVARRAPTDVTESLRSAGSLKDAPYHQPGHSVRLGAGYLDARAGAELHQPAGTPSHQLGCTQ